MLPRGRRVFAFSEVGGISPGCSATSDFVDQWTGFGPGATNPGLGMARPDCRTAISPAIPAGRDPKIDTLAVVISVSSVIETTIGGVFSRKEKTTGESLSIPRRRQWAGRVRRGAARV